MKLATLDLHAVIVADVADRVDRFLVQQNAKGATRARIMTGKGTGAVQKAVIAYLKLGGFPWQYEPGPTKGTRNEGVLVIILE
jgi:DNA-nicking Smr family endonuclease